MTIKAFGKYFWSKHSDFLIKMNDLGYIEIPSVLLTVIIYKILLKPYYS